MKLRLWLIPLTFILGSQFIQAQHLLNHEENETTDVIDPEFLDGFVGIGGGVVQHLTAGETGVRQNLHLEFTRLRKSISLDTRFGFGGSYSDFGLLFRVYRHWRFNPKNSTGLSLGVGAGGLYSPGETPENSTKKAAFVDLVAAPFARFLWDWGNGMGIEASLEYQLVPYQVLVGAKEQDQKNDNTLYSRVGFNLSLLFEAD